MWLLRSVSLPYLSRHKLRTFLTLVGIAAGVATMVATGMVTDSVFSSFATTVHSAMGGADLRVTASGLGLAESVVDDIRLLTDIAETGPVVDGFVSLPGAAGDELAILGVDVLSDPRSAVKIREGVIELPDQLGFVTQPDSVILPRPLAEEMGLEIGESFSVRCPQGICRLMLRGLMPGGGIASLFGGRVAVMDLPAAQALLGETARIDHVDVWVVKGADLETASARIGEALHGAAWIERGEAAEQRAKQLLMAIRVFLTMAAFVAVAVGFFIVYHTVAASIQQRRQHLAVLNAVGISKRALLRWLTLESVALAAVATLAGVALGVVAAKVAVSMFGTVTSAWVPTRAPQAVLTVRTTALAVALALATVIGATLLACSTLFRRSTAQQLSSVQANLSRPEPTRRLLVAALTCFVLATALIAVAPATLPYGWLVSYVLAVLFFLLLGFGLLAPVVVHGLAGIVLGVARNRPGIAVMLAASNVTRNPGGFVVVVTAIVMALASTLASFSLTASLKHSGLTWLTDHYRGDVVLTAEGAFLRVLTSPPIAPSVVDDVRRQPGVAAVQSVRAVEVRHSGLPTVLLAYDRAPEGLTLYEGRWDDIAERFWTGDGVLVSDNLARMREIRRGHSIELPSPSGGRMFEVLGVFPDYTGGSQLGSIAIARDTYRATWHDDLASRVNVWVTPGSEIPSVARSLTDRFLDNDGLRALTLDEIRNETTAFIDDAFAVMYALVAVSLFVSFVGVANFLATVLADRDREMRSLRGIGVSPAQNFAAVVTEGGLVGVTGALVGMAAGLAISAVITYHSVPMVTGWLFLFVFPPVPAVVLAVGTVALAAAAGLPAAGAALRSRPSPNESAA